MMKPEHIRGLKQTPHRKKSRNTIRREGVTRAEKRASPLSGGGRVRQVWMRSRCCSLCPLRLGWVRAGTGEEGEKNRQRVGFWEVNTADYDHMKLHK